MRIAAHIGVKNEAELIDRAIRHLRAIGIDLIIAVDAFSTDGTRDILSRHSKEGDLFLVQMSDLEPDGPERLWLRRNLELVQSAKVDWAVFLDADELLIPASGHLRDCAGLADADVLTIDRFNVVLGAEGPCLPETLAPWHYDELMLFTSPIPDFRFHLESHPETPWIRGVPVPKILARPERISGLTDGMHGAIPMDGVELRKGKSADLIIAHLPFTTYERFRGKVDNIHAVMKVHDEYFGEHLAWQWRRWLECAAQGRLRDEFDRQVTDERALTMLRAQGIVRSAAEIFAERTALAAVDARR
jgi:hypothetical protein